MSNYNDKDCGKFGKFEQEDQVGEERNLDRGERGNEGDKEYRSGKWDQGERQDRRDRHRRWHGPDRRERHDWRDRRNRRGGGRLSRGIHSTFEDISPEQLEIRQGQIAGHEDNENRDNKPMVHSRSKYRKARNKANVSNEYVGLEKADIYPNTYDKSLNERQKPRCPLHLKGKEIGLWYKDQKALKTKEEFIEILVGEETQAFLEQFVNKTAFDLSLNESELQCFSSGQAYETFEERANARYLRPKEGDIAWDNMLTKELVRKRKERNYIDFINVRKMLPAFKLRWDIVNFIAKHQITVISGGTGCGKTTQIVQFVLDDFIMRKKGSLCNILCTQPRRISAVSVAERVAAERLEPICQSVGYQIRLENKLAERKTGCINFVTTGILLQWLILDPILEGVTHLFLDEVHERTVECDAVMALLKYIIPRRPDLKIILMSATVNANSFCAYFNGAPSMEIPGFAYEVEEIFLEDILKMTNFKFRDTKKVVVEPAFKDFILPYVRDIESRGLYPKSVTKELAKPHSEELDISLVTDVVRHICHAEDEGAILVFLPGLTDLTNLNREIIKSPWFSHNKYLLVLVHSMLPSVEQKEAFVIPPRGVRKIIIATSILETSVTVNDISYVVDCGKKKLCGYDLKHKVATLHASWISLANAKQRTGRAGRTRNGKCYKLYTRARQSIFDEFPTPEVKTTSLEQVILEAKALKIRSVAAFLEKLMDPPDPEMVELALKALRNLSALDKDERLTPLGLHLSKLPLDPQAGKMILMGALFSCIDPIFSIAACLSFKDPFSIPLGQEERVINIKEGFAKGEASDHFIYSEVLRQWENESPSQRHHFSYRNFLSNQTLCLLSEMKKQFAEILHSMNFLPSSNVRDPRSNVNSENKELLKAIICAGLYPNVAILKNIKKEAVLKTLDNRTVRFHLKSYCNHVDWFESPFFIYHYKLKSSSIFIHDASMVTILPLLLFGKDFNITYEDNRCSIEVDEFLRFKISRQCGYLIKTVRKRLDWILGSAILRSEGFNWNAPGEKIEILSGIVDLISRKNFKHKIRFEL